MFIYSMCIQTVLFQCLRHLIYTYMKTFPTIPSPKFMRGITFFIKELFQHKEQVPGCDCLNKEMMQLPIKEEKDRGQRERGARHTILLLPNTTGHSLSSRHNTPHSWVPAAILLLFPLLPPHLSPFNMGVKNEGGMGGWVGWKWIVGKHIQSKT